MVQKSVGQRESAIHSNFNKMKNVYTLLEDFLFFLWLENKLIFKTCNIIFRGTVSRKVIKDQYWFLFYIKGVKVNKICISYYHYEEKLL